MENIAQILPMIMLKDASDEVKKTGMINMLMANDKSSAPMANVLTVKKLAEIDDDHEKLKSDHKKLKAAYEATLAASENLLNFMYDNKDDISALTWRDGVGDEGFKSGLATLTQSSEDDFNTNLQALFT